MMSKTKKFFYLSNLSNKNFKIKYILLILINFINVILEFLGLASIIPLIGFITKNNNDIFGISLIIEKIQLYTNVSEINIYVSIIVFIFILRNIIGILAVYLSTRYVHQFTINISDYYFKSKLSLPFLEFSTKGSNFFTRNLRDVISNFRAFILSFIMFFSEMLILLSILALFLYLNFLPTLIVLMVLTFILFFFVPFIRTKVRNWSVLRNESSANIIRVLLNTFNNIREIKVFKKEEFISNYFSKFNTSFSDVLRKYDFSIIVLRNYVEIAALVLVILFGIFFFNEDSSDEILTILGFYIVAFVRIYPSINRFVSYYLGIRNNQIAVDTLYDDFMFINKFSNLNETSDQKFEFNKKIQVKINYHKFPTSKNSILENIEFDIEKNSLIALNGPNGCGKTTISNFILGLMRPTSGKILIDEKYDINNLGNKYRNILSFVPQNTFLFEGTIYENIVFGDELDNFKKSNAEKIEKIINSSKLFEFIDKLDKKIYSHIKENGSNFSGGQKQSISIARALYYDPKILVLDEPTSSLDKSIKSEFFKLILDLKKNITVIIITHDQSLLDICDKVINLKAGKNE